MKIDSVEEFNELLKKENHFFFMKHSLTCPISANAYQEFNRFLDQTDAKGYYLAVQESRSLSNHIAETFGIKHESPQAFLVDHGEVLWHASHSRITKNELEKQMTKS
ncbi:bacillithiol system redox-active protein YtxJ [Falsibacillus albus]|uniref:Bacillithiol system redox-active protein YtxJ n=1 Tax=Falsibacillus albus TaxID=2478915 RepID=A0A3L7K4F5_9BACI|nr:bacillithiol system redox-active protein YtxJ [Falsibacillus albus]RLQ97908.1 bacillithiol system redox-active protein YtxJ [Falsibacillus albus]